MVDMTYPSNCILTYQTNTLNHDLKMSFLLQEEQVLAGMSRLCLLYQSKPGTAVSGMPHMGFVAVYTQWTEFS